MTRCHVSSGAVEDRRGWRVDHAIHSIIGVESVSSSVLASVVWQRSSSDVEKSLHAIVGIVFINIVTVDSVPKSDVVGNDCGGGIGMEVPDSSDVDQVNGT